MTSVRIKLSWAVIDQEHAMASGMPVSGGMPGCLLNVAMKVAAAIEEGYSKFAS